MKENHIAENERFSRMLKTDKFAPVITTCLYLGEPEWDGTRSLKEMLALISDKSMLIAERREKLKSYHESRHVAPEVARAVYSITRRKVLPVKMEE